MNASNSSNHGGAMDIKYLKHAVPDELSSIVESRRNSFLNDASNENKSQGSGDRYTPVHSEMDTAENKLYSNYNFYQSDNDRDGEKGRDRDKNGNKEKERTKVPENVPYNTEGENFGETYSLIRERNSLLTRLEQVFIAFITFM